MKPSELIADPARWTTGAFARNCNGNHVVHWDGDATCWCGDGALMRCLLPMAPSGFAIDSTAYWSAFKAANEKSKELYGTDFISLNDGPDGHARVLHVLREIGQ